MSASDAVRRWNALTSIATLGTNRAAPSLQQLLPSSVSAIPEGPTERTLLRVAAMNDLWQLSGVRAPEAPPPADEPAPVTDERAVSENAAWRLGRMLNGEHRELVPEWIALATRAQLVIPPHWLPVALDKLTTRERAGASAVLGSRAIWLGKRNHAWSVSVASSTPSEDRWLEGALAQRTRELAAIRAADPALARKWLARTWSTETPEARAQFISTLLNAPGLSSEDEPFLEAALDDKRKDVRVLASASLARLPDSGHARRNREALEPLIAFTGRRRLGITLPESLDKVAVRDGIEPKPPAQRKIGERAWWLMQRVAVAPPSWWCEKFGCEPGAFIDAAVATDYGTDLLLSLAEAASRARDVAWISALSERLVAWSGPMESALSVHQALVSLLMAAPSENREAILEPLLGALTLARFDLMLLLLGSLDVEWGAGSTRQAFELLEKRVKDDTQTYVYPRNTLTNWGIHADVATASAALLRILERCPDKSPWRNALETLNDTFDFRMAMRRELLK